MELREPDPGSAFKNNCTETGKVIPHTVTESPPSSVFPLSSFLLRSPSPGDVLVASGSSGEAQEGHAAAGRVLRPPEEGAGENLPEAEIHQQTRQEEAGRQTGAEGLSGEQTRTIRFNVLCFAVTL